jgi:hypothetical protein
MAGLPLHGPMQIILRNSCTGSGISEALPAPKVIHRKDAKCAKVLWFAKNANNANETKTQLLGLVLFASFAFLADK